MALREGFELDLQSGQAWVGRIELVLGRRYVFHFEGNHRIGLTAAEDRPTFARLFRAEQFRVRDAIGPRVRITLASEIDGPAHAFGFEDE